MTKFVQAHDIILHGKGLPTLKEREVLKEKEEGKGKKEKGKRPHRGRKGKKINPSC